MPASNPRFGDYQVNVALSLAKQLQQNPRTIAQTIVQHAQLDGICYPRKLLAPALSILP